MSSKALIRAITDGKDVAKIRKMVKGMWPSELAKVDKEWRTALHYAFYQDTAVFTAVLKAMSKEAIMLENEMGYDVLHEALRQGKKEIVLLVVKRMKKEKKWNPFAHECHVTTNEDGRKAETKVDALVRGPLISDRETVDLVAAYVPKHQFYFDVNSDDVLTAVRSKEPDVSYAIEMCCSVGASMEERVTRSRHRLLYVGHAGSKSNLARVKLMHDLVPLLKDGSGRKAAPEAYAAAINTVVFNEDAINIIKYLLEQGGAESLGLCIYNVLWRPRSLRVTKFLVRQAPIILTRACCETVRQGQHTVIIGICRMSPEGMKYLVRKIVEQVESGEIDRERLASLLDQVDNLPSSSSLFTPGWAQRLDPLWEIVPEVLCEKRWALLMMTIRRKHVEAADYFLSHCTQDDLTRTNVHGATAKEEALKFGFPEEMVARMSRVTKNAYA